jgi:hypothetical protein
MTGEFSSTIRVYEDGTFKMFNKDLLTKFLSSHAGETLDIIVRKKRTGQQNKYFWVAMQIVGDELGFSKEVAHDIFCKIFLTEEEVSEKTGEAFTRIKGTRELSKLEMMKFIDQIIIYCADELHIVLPEPGEKLKLNIE